MSKSFIMYIYGLNTPTLTNTVDFLVHLSTMMVTFLTSTSNSERNS